MVSLLEDTKPAKPRLRRAGNVWSCMTIAGFAFGVFAYWRIGYGYTPLEAWKDWEAQA